MQQVILLNGPAGVGKTTTSRLLAKEFSSSVVIHGDDLKNFVIKKPKVVENRLSYKNCALLSNVYIEAGYQTVVVEFVFEHPDHIEHYKSFYAEKAPIKIITLWANLDTIIKREKNRMNREPLGDRVPLCYQEIHKNISNMGCVINTERKSPDEVVKDILVSLKKQT